jgi:hypothetical protein
MRNLSLAVCLTATIASAATVTSGYVTVTGNLVATGSFSFSGNNFSVSGNFSEGPWPTNGCYLLPFGSACSPNGSVVGNDFGGGSGTQNGNVYPGVSFGDLLALGPSFFSFTGPSIAIPAPGTYSGTFTFDGALCGTDSGSPEPDHPCLIDLPELTGYGTVTLVVDADPSEPDVMMLRSVTYTFVPEPNAAWLIGPAMAALVFLRRRRA